MDSYLKKNAFWAASLLLCLTFVAFAAKVAHGDMSVPLVFALIVGFLMMVTPGWTFGVGLQAFLATTLFLAGLLSDVPTHPFVAGLAVLTLAFLSSKDAVRGDARRASFAIYSAESVAIFLLLYSGNPLVSLTGAAVVFFIPRIFNGKEVSVA